MPITPLRSRSKTRCPKPLGIGTRRNCEEAQPGRVEEVEGTAPPENAIVISGPEAPAPSESGEPSAALKRYSTQDPSVQIPYASSEGPSSPENSNSSAGSSPAAGEASGPQVVLKIRRRKFNQQQFRAGEIV